MKIAFWASLACLGLAQVQGRAVPARVHSTQDQANVSVATILGRELDLSHFPDFRNWVPHLNSSYDRSGGNGDFDQFLHRDGTTATLADLQGPGAVVRIWTPNPSGQLKIYVDGSPVPVVDLPFAKLYDGSVPEFPHPLVAASTGGFYSYVPIPYAKSCKITVDNSQGLYYQVNSVKYNVETNVETFSTPFNAVTKQALAMAGSKFSGTDWPLPVDELTTPTAVSAPGKQIQLFNRSGPGVVRDLVLEVPDLASADLKKIVLRGYFDDHRAADIEAPLPDFFGDGFARRTNYGSMFTRRNGRRFEVRFPMPFGKRARFTIENGTSSPLGFSYRATVDRKPFYLATAGYFHAQWIQDLATNGVPHVWLHDRGHGGRLIGIVQTMSGPHGLGFLEGDDQVRVDNESWLPSAQKGTVIGPWNGTGTEDFFNSGWYFSGGLNALPLNGVTQRDDAGRVSAYRWFLDDAPVYRSSIEAQIEHGGANDAGGTYYSSVAYWYSDGPNPYSSRIRKASLVTLPMPAPPRYVQAGAIEGEDLIGTAHVTGGRLLNQDMGSYKEAWSGDSQLWWIDNKAGDTLDLKINVPSTADYDVSAWFTKAVDYGQFKISVDGHHLAQPLNLYHDGVQRSEAVSLGRLHLTKGPATIHVTTLVSDSRSKGFLFGLDDLTLKPVH